MKLDHLRLLGAFGTNKIMAGELSRLCKRALDGERSRELLAVPPRKVGPGGIVYPYAHDLAAVAVTYHRTSARVLWDVALSGASRLEPLYAELYEDFLTDERPWFTRGGKLSVLAFGTQSVEAGDRQVVGVVKNAVIDAGRARGIDWEVDADEPDVILHVRAVPTGDSEESAAKTELTVSLDLAGRPMHQRGYRLAHGDAPLREDLAAALVLLARHSAKEQSLVDPMAGSGTILLEAGLLASAASIWQTGEQPIGARLPGLGEALSALPPALFPDTAAELYGAEIDPMTAGHLQDNAVRAGLRERITLHSGDFRDWDLGKRLAGRPPGLILTNPPYGARMGGSPTELGRLYKDLATFCRSLPGGGAGWTAAFLVGDASEEERAKQGDSNRESSVALFIRSVGGKPRIKKPLSNGPLRGQFLLYDL
jgi:23S rRNA G2445 N2-methylase RlmL